MIQNTNAEFRLTENTLLEVIKPNNSLMTFNVLNYSVTNRNHFIYIPETPEEDNLYLGNNTDNLVFEGNINPFNIEHRINQLYTTTLIDDATISVISDTVQNRYFECLLHLRQGFSWQNVFGLLVVVRDTLNSNRILYSSMMRSNQFVIYSNVNEFNGIDKKLINGSFWTHACRFIIPRFDSDLDNVIVDVKTITWDDISSENLDLGKVYTYPTSITDFEPLITSKLLPDYVQTKLEVNNRNFFELSVVTLQPFKTVRQSILDYLSMQNYVDNIICSHLITYGTEELGWRSLRLQNEDDNLAKIVFALDLIEFTDNVKPIIIFIQTEIFVSGIKLTRTTTINYDYYNVVDPIVDEVYSVNQQIEYYGVEHKVENVIQQNVIETKKEQKIVEIYVPVISMMVTGENIPYESTNIVLQNPNIQSGTKMIVYFSGSEKVLFVKPASDNQFYFDFGNELQRPEKETQYKLFNGNTVIQTGNIIP